MYKMLSVLVLAASLAGCNSLIASATGPEPIGQAEGSRTISMKLEDSGIERTAGVNILKADPLFREANVHVKSFYGNVLLAGQVQNEEMKDKAEAVVRRIAEVKQIHNELTIGAASYYGERWKDGNLTNSISRAFLFEKGFPSSRTKVFTVGGTVYLMGKLTQAEADTAVDIIKQKAGVKKIVKLVDTLASPEATTPSAE